MAHSDSHGGHHDEFHVVPAWQLMLTATARSLVLPDRHHRGLPPKVDFAEWDLKSS